MDYEDYISTSTGERAVVPSYTDPATGVRHTLVRLSSEYVPAWRLHAVEVSESAADAG
jgi:hypothetical protein